MDRRQASRTIRAGLVAASLAIFCFGMTFVLAVFYIA
jgi:hypothetical protein